MDMTGCLCPKCRVTEVHLLSTTNELKYYCPKCDERFDHYVMRIEDTGNFRNYGEGSDRRDEK